MSARITRMETASSDIFAYIAENPEKAPQIRRFMNYYLPTTIRLLASYDKLSRQRVKGENIQKTMFEIEGMMGRLRPHLKSSSTAFSATTRWTSPPISA